MFDMFREGINVYCVDGGIHLESLKDQSYGCYMAVQSMLLLPSFVVHTVVDQKQTS
jgi:hypothetical protein